MQSDQTGRREDVQPVADSTRAGEGRGTSARREDTAARHDDTAARHGDSAPDDFNIFRQPWLVVACLLLAASVVLLLLSHADAAFVCAALGISAWFWNMRAGLKRKHNLKKVGGRNWVQCGDEEDED